MQLTHTYLTEEYGKITGKINVSQLRLLNVPENLIQGYLNESFKKKEFNFEKFKNDKQYRRRMLKRAHETLQIQQKIESFLAQNYQTVPNYYV